MSVSDPEAIETTRQEFLRAYKIGDAAALAECCSNDVVQLPPHEPAVRGKEAVRARYQAQFDRFVCDLITTTEELEIAGSWAFAWGAYSVSLTPKNGGSLTQDRGKYLVIFKQEQNGSWKFARDTFNSDHP